jgi:hypothetical protein
MFGSDFAPSEKIAFAQHAHEISRRIHDGEATDMMRKHQFDRIGDRSLRPDRQDSPGHYVMRAHIVHSERTQEAISRARRRLDQDQRRDEPGCHSGSQHR